jgi:hypothetical protein
MFSLIAIGLFALESYLILQLTKFKPLTVSKMILIIVYLFNTLMTLIGLFLPTNFNNIAHSIYRFPKPEDSPLSIIILTLIIAFVLPIIVIIMCKILISKSQTKNKTTLPK